MTWTRINKNFKSSSTFQQTFRTNFPFNLDHVWFRNKMIDCNRELLRNEKLWNSLKISLWFIKLLTLEMMIPAILIRIFGPLRRRYLRSTPFQNDTKYRLIWKLIFWFSIFDRLSCKGSFWRYFIRFDYLLEYYHHRVICNHHNPQ